MGGEMGQFTERAAWRPDSGAGVRKLVIPEWNRKGVDEKRRAIEFVVSTGDRDRDGDVIDPEGWDLSTYRRNPVVLWAHDSGSPPIARCEDIRVENGRLVARAVFAGLEQMHPDAEKIFRLYRDGFLNAVSAGFYPKAYESFEEDGKSGFRFDQTELWEFSAVPIPSNPNALMRAKSAGLNVEPMVHGADLMLRHACAEMDDETRDKLSRLFTQETKRVHEAMTDLVRARNARARRATKGDPRPLYVKRQVLNAGEIIEWAKGQGFKTTLPAEDMHVTVAFSRSPVDWAAVTPHDGGLVETGGARSVRPLGDKGAVVLHFDSEQLQARWKALCDAGCSWDHDGYSPHITLSYSGAPDDVAKIEAFAGPITLGPEVMRELDEDWADKIREASAPEGKAPEGSAFTTTGGEDHEHGARIGESMTDEAGDPPHRHAISYGADGAIEIGEAEGHSHAAPEGLAADMPDEEGEDDMDKMTADQLRAKRDDIEQRLARFDARQKIIGGEWIKALAERAGVEKAPGDLDADDLVLCLAAAADEIAEVRAANVAEPSAEKIKEAAALAAKECVEGILPAAIKEALGPNRRAQ